MFKKKGKAAISEDNPLVVGDLKVFPNRLQYKDVKCNLLDIEHIGWYWVSQTINIINTQDVRLSLYIRGRKKPVELKKTTMYVTPKIVQAYNFIAKNTFQNRLRFYTDQLSQSGGFNYDNCSIYSDGRVVSNGKTYSLSKADVEPFRISIKQGGLFSSRVKIDLTVDRDIVLTLVDFILKNPQDPNVYVEGHNQQKGANRGTTHFLRDVVSMMAKLSGADGHVSPEEIAIVKRFLLESMRLPKEEFSEAISIFNIAKASPDSFESYAQTFFAGFARDKRMLLGVLDILFSIAVADGVLSAEEELLLLEAEAIFGVTGEAFSKFRTKTRKSSTDIESYYLKVLGLSPGASKEEIRLEYKRLVMKFHPDRVHHLGETFVKETEVRMKELNQAYKYLCR